MTDKTKAAGTETKKFKAEVKQVLDIVINSLYTHREIFIRELISNASDALEKMRHEALTVDNYTDKDVPLEITIESDKDAHTFTITDSGIGMSHDELANNLGTIARSGTREFMENMDAEDGLHADMIGKFGVGFYSTFMVAEEVTVRTRSYRPNASGYEWVSDGTGEYTITKLDDLPRGTSITLKLKESASEYEDETVVKNTITKYSNFVSFPILVGGEKVNTIEAIWLKSSSEVSDEEYNDFFKFIGNAMDEPLSRIHMSADAPIQLSALLYVPPMNLEQFGLMKMKPSVSLYCRKVLIEQNTDKLLPEYMRFISGVVDSEDLPLNISRETLQDNLIFRKMGKFLTKRVIRHLADTAKKDPESYSTIWERFGLYIKEGISSDFENKNDLAKLLRFRSSKFDDATEVSFEDYIGRMGEDQKDIYYLNGRTREEIENGPYMKAFNKEDIEVLYLYQPADDFVMSSLIEFEEKKLVSADSADIDLPKDDKEDEKERQISEDDLNNLAAWMKETIGDRVSEVREAKRLLDRPAIIVNPDDSMTTTMQRVMKAAGRDYPMSSERILEINADHPLIGRLKELRDGDTDKDFLQSCVLQLFDNALAEAGLLDDPRDMVERVYSIMEKALSSDK